MNARTTSLMLALAVCGAARADGTSRASFAVFAGANTEMPGTFRGQTTPLVTGDGTITYDDLKFEDAYDHRYTMGAEFDYAFNPQFSGYGRYAYAEFNGREHEVGNLFTYSAGVVPVSANFDDTNTQEFDLGGRFNFMPGAKWQPFVGASLGATRLGATRADFPDANGGMTKVTLGESDTVFSQRFETGLQYSPMANFGLRLSAAANHLDADTKSSDPNLALVGLNPAGGEVRSHWDYPIELAAVWNFGS